jgi:hypothetical protein
MKKKKELESQQASIICNVYNQVKTFNYKTYVSMWFKIHENWIEPKYWTYFIFWFATNLI